MNLTPENTMERILNGEDVTPSCRAEYFVKQAIDNAGGGGSVTVDSELSETSENPVQNKVITAALADKADTADLKEPLFVHGTWADAEGGNPNTVTITTPLADIYAAAQAGRAVFLEYTEDGVTTRMGLYNYSVTNGEYTLGFSICIEMSDKPTVAAVVFENTLVGAVSIVADAIPIFTSADAGKVLAVNSYGVLEWVMPT